MKISLNNRLNHYLNPSENAKTNVSKLSQRKISKNFDELIIHSNNTASEDKFISDLTNKISKEVRTSASSYKMQDIQSQVENGTYQIGLDEVVKKLMLI